MKCISIAEVHPVLRNAKNPGSLTSSNSFSLDILRTSSRLYSLTHGFEQKKHIDNLNDNEKNFLINCVDFSHDSVITKQALMALTVPKVEKSWDF